jgi:hypothetical protein
MHALFIPPAYIAPFDVTSVMSGSYSTLHVSQILPAMHFLHFDLAQL